MKLQYSNTVSYRRKSPSSLREGDMFFYAPLSALTYGAYHGAQESTSGLVDDQIFYTNLYEYTGNYRCKNLQTKDVEKVMDLDVYIIDDMKVDYVFNS